VIQPSDEELLAAHLRGDRDAFGQLVGRHERRVYGICLRMLGNREDAQDAAQETFVSALRRASSFRQEAAFSTWLYRIAVNASTDQARRRGRARTTPLEPGDAGMADPVPGRGDPGDAVATAVTVQAALTRLPEEFRAAVVLCDLLRLPYAEAAAILDVPVGTVKSRVYRGRLALAGELGGDPPPRPVAAPTPPDLRVVQREATAAGGRPRPCREPGTAALARASETDEPRRDPDQE
jgi:RNA polymerase sigma-70 factor (ECF subfamily)